MIGLSVMGDGRAQQGAIEIAVQDPPVSRPYFAFIAK
jgi:hypothetical protein